MNSLKTRISDLRVEPEYLSRSGPTIVEVYSLVDEEGDPLDQSFSYEEVTEDLKEYLGIPDSLMKKLHFYDMIHIREDYSGVWLFYYDGNTDKEDQVWYELQKYLKNI